MSLAGHNPQLCPVQLAKKQDESVFLAKESPLQRLANSFPAIWFRLLVSVR